MIPTTILVFGGVALTLILVIAVLWLMYFLRLPGYVRTATKPHDFTAELQSTLDPKANSGLSNTVWGHENPKFDLGAELKVLSDLHESGSLTDDEFELAKNKLLRN